MPAGAKRPASTRAFACASCNREARAFFSPQSEYSSPAQQTERMSREAAHPRATHLPVRDNRFTRSAVGRAIDQAIADDVPGLAAELAYRAVLAVLPFLLMLAA